MSRVRSSAFSIVLLTTVLSHRVAAQPALQWVTANQQGWQYNVDWFDALAEQPPSESNKGGWLVTGGANPPHNVNVFDASYLQFDGNGQPVRSEWIGPQRQTPGNGIMIEGRSILRTKTGSLISGSTDTGIFPHYHDTSIGASDGFLESLDMDGNEIWGRCYGGSDNDALLHVIRAHDGSYVCVGWTESNDGDIHGYHPGGFILQEDIWVQKVDSAGNLLWERTYGGKGWDYPAGIVELPDGSLAIAGSTNSRDGDIATPLGGNDIWLLHLDTAGKLLWQQTFGTSHADVATGIGVTPDGNILVGGSIAHADSNTGGGYGFYGYPCTGWAAEFSPGGSLLWQTDSNAWGNYYPHAMTCTPDGAVLLAGSGPDINDTVHQWIAKIDHTGKLLWRDQFVFRNVNGGSDSLSKPSITAIACAADGGFAVTGSSEFAHVSTPFIARFAPDAPMDVRSTVHNGTSLLAFPMPATRTLFLESDGNGIETMSLYNGLGVEVLRSNLSVTQLDVSGLPRGVYHLTAIVNGSRASSNVILQ